MPPERSRRVESLYHAALERDGEARDHFLENECAGDETLRHEVESLLRHGVAMHAFFDGPAVELAAAAGAARPVGARLVPLEPGSRIGVYELVMLLGAGGMGEVYKARDTRLGRPVAIKLLPETLVPDTRARRYFEREAKAISRLNHPHICTLYDIGHHEGMDYLVMEFLAGETIREQLERGPFPSEQVIRYGTQIAEALAEAHRCGLLHGDLKPSNVMVTANGAKVLDFGLARPLDLAYEDTDTSPTVLSRQGVAGTLPYMAPEQLENQGGDVRSDIFSFGALLYEMFSGRRPFNGATVPALVAAILRCDPAPLPATGSGAQALGRVIRKCLVRNPDERWQRLEELLDVLRSLRTTARLRRKSRQAQPKAGARSIRRLVVLPFENLSPDTLEEYVPDGLTDALTSALSAIRPLRVISRASSLRFEDHRRDLAVVAHTLGVDGVIRGHVSGSAERVEVRLDLVQAATGLVLWSETYDCPLDDVLRAQNDIAATMAITLQLELTPADRKRRAAAWSHDRAANEAYLRGRYFLDRVTLDGLRRSFQYLSSAVQKDPAHGRAHAALAEWYYSAAPFRLIARSEALPKAKAAALEAIKLDPTLDDARACLGMIATLEWDLHRAGLEFSQALQLNPNSVKALRGLARCASWLGDHQAALEQVEFAAQLDPVAPKTLVAVASVSYVAGEFERAIAASLAALELEPQSEPAQYFLGMAQHFAGRGEASIDLLTRASRESPTLLSGLAFVRAQNGRADDALRVIDEMKERATTQEEVSPYDFAEAFVGLGDVDRALGYLTRACELRLPEMVGVGVDPVFVSLHEDPRFRRILRAVGLKGGATGGVPPSSQHEPG
jgi:eukaryotic-like serine/threonine-protein kinase